MLTWFGQASSVHRGLRANSQRNAMPKAGTTPPTTRVVRHHERVIAQFFSRRYGLPICITTQYCENYLLPAVDDVGQCTCNDERYAAEGVGLLTTASLKCLHMSASSYLQGHRRSCWQTRCCHSRRRPRTEQKRHLQAG